MLWKWQQNIISGKHKKHSVFIFKLMKKELISHKKNYFSLKSRMENNCALNIFLWNLCDI